MTETAPGSDDIAAAEDPVVEKARRLTDAEFAEIRELYELGTAGLTDLADKYKISRQALSKRFKDAGVVRGSRAAEVAEAAKKAAAAAAASSVTPVVERFIEKRDQWVEETRVGAIHNMALVERLTKKTIKEALDARKPLAAYDDEFKAIERIKKILIDASRHKLIDVLEASDLIDEDNLPTLVLEDLTDEDILNHHKSIDDNITDDMPLEDIIGEAALGEAD